MVMGFLVGRLVSGNVYMYTRDKESNKMGRDDGIPLPLSGQATDGKGLIFMIYICTHSSNDFMLLFILFVRCVSRPTLK